MHQITPIPAFQDNYIWMIVDTTQQQAIIVDPGDAAPVLSTLETQKLSLHTLLITHHHHDHTGGIPQLHQTFPDLNIIAYRHATQIPYTQAVDPGDTLAFFNNTLELTVQHIPGHTLDHIAYSNDHMCFCGDTLFSAGCGRLFEGSAEQLFQSLQKLAALPTSTRIYCAHEYTLDNLHFAHTVEPDNESIQHRINDIKTLRQNQQPSLPTTLAIEHQTNPFLRTHQPTVKTSAEQYCGHTLTTELEVFTVLRQWKDHF